MPSPVSTPIAVALAVASGALYFLAFPPVDLGTAAFVALVPLLWAVRDQSRGRVLLLGWVAGTVAAYTLVAAPIWQAASRLSPDRPWVAWSLALAIPQLYGALYFALFGLWAREIQARRLPPAVEAFAVAAAWTASEFMRARIGEGCPWNLLAHSQHARLWLLQVADLGGASAVTFVVAVVNVAVAMLPRREYRPRRLLLPLATTLAVLAVVRLYGQSRLLRWDRPGDELVRVALVQGDVPDAWRYSLVGLPQATHRLLDLTSRVLESRPALIVWPENALTVAVAGNERLFAPLAGQLAAGARLLLGAPRAETSGGGVVLRNSAYLIDERGRALSVYDKIHLTPYGESLPEVVGAFVGDARDDQRYSPGERWTLFQVAGYRFAAVICFEAIYSDLVRHFVHDGAEFLVNISNDGWFGAQPSLDQHFNAALLRAVENRRFLLRATNAGITAVIDPCGLIVSAAPRGVPTTLIADIAPISELSVYTRVGDVFAWVMLVVALVALAPRRASTAAR